MGTAADHAYLIWSLTTSGLGTTLTTSGNSGGYSTANPNARTAIDFRFGWADDIWLSASATGGAGTNLIVILDAYDAQGNLFGGSTGLGQGTPMSVTLATAPLSKVTFGGRHGGAGGAYFVLPEWGQISWTLTGSMTGCEISLYGR